MSNIERKMNNCYVESDWMNKSNKFGHYAIERYLEDYISDFVNYLDYSEGGELSDEGELNIDHAEFTAHIEDKFHDYKINVTFNFEAIAYFDYTATAHGSNEEWGWDIDCEGHVDNFTLTTCPNLEAEGLDDYDECEFEQFTITDISIENISKYNDTNFLESVDAFNAMSLEDKIEFLRKHIASLDFNISCEDLNGLLNFVFGYSLGSDLYLYD